MLDDHEPTFGKNVIETLSEGMYDNPLFLFREYVQNAADAIDMAENYGILGKGEGQIEVTVDEGKRLITFEDNGTGIRKDEIKKMLANIGDSQKDRKTNKGFRGIGRLGGLGYCQKIRFETSAQGESIKSFLEWDAQNLHDILADKNERIHAGELIKRITSTWNEPCASETHFFKVSLIDINTSNDDLLDIEDIRRYLSMVAPIPYDYAKFRFVEEIENFIQQNSIPPLHEYRLNLNGDEVRKGYETPLKIGDGKSIDILDVKCHPIFSGDKMIGWYWFCVSKFEGVLPKKCWQRGLRLRKANIQIGEADCLTNHPKRGQTLWREDRGNNYFIGEIHVFDDNLIPNSRRDYFNQDKACRDFEAALSKEFQLLHKLYHDASVIRSAVDAIEKAQTERKIFIEKENSGSIYNAKERENILKKIQETEGKAEKAKQTIEKYKKCLGLNVNTPATQVLQVYTGKLAADATVHIPSSKTVKYAKDKMPKNIRDVLSKVFYILEKMLPPEQAEPIRDAIIKRVTDK